MTLVKQSNLFSFLIAARPGTGFSKRALNLHLSSQAGHLLQVFAAVWLLTGCAAPRLEETTESSSQRPNVLFILADQWRGSAFGFAGDPNVKTPHLDRLAGESLRFENAVSVCPVCTPYRAALLTGRYPTSTGMFLNDACLPESELCLAQVFKQAGYATGYIGKWHLDGHGRSSYIPPERRRGFDYWKAAECDHNYTNSHYYSGTSPEKKFWPGYDAFAQTRDAQQYLRDHARAGRPFFLFVAYGIPHFPHGSAPPEYKALYPSEKIKFLPNVPEEMRTAKVRTEAQGYYAHCSALDKCVGDLLATLAETGLAQNTILVFTSDHGEMMGSHVCPPYMKQVPWNESAQVPFLLRYPPVQRTGGRRIATPLTTPDIFPTMTALAGLEIPGTVEGRDLSRILRAPVEIKDRAALFMGVAPFNGPKFERAYRAVRTAQYTYVRSLDGPWLLFDNRLDPFQTNNLVDHPAFRQVRQQMEARLQQELKGIGDDFRPPKYYVEKFGYTLARHGSISYERGAASQTPRPGKANK